MLNTITVCVCVLARLFSPIYGLRVTDIQYLCIYSVIYIFLISSLTQRFSSEIVGIWNRIYAVLDRSEPELDDTLCRSQSSLCWESEDRGREAGAPPATACW